MNEITAFLITMLAALAGSFLAKKCRLPAGAMTGAIVAVSIYNCLTAKAALPVFAKPCMQVMGGALLGHSISQKDLKKIPDIIKAAAVLIIALFLLNMTIGFVVWKLTDMNLATALLATAPGGVSDMALIAEDFGADMRIVSIMQMFRMFGIYLVFPPILRCTQKKGTGKRAAAGQRHSPKEQLNDTKNSWKYCLTTITAAFAGGALFNMAGIPAGYMVGSVVFCAVLNITKNRGYIPGDWRFFIQSVTGAIIGCQMTKEGLGLFGKLALPVLLLIGGMLIFTFLFGKIMARVSELDFQTSLLCLTPGGIQETSLLADDLGCDTPCVVVMHTIRLVVVICIFPVFLQFLAGVF